MTNHRASDRDVSRAIRSWLREDRHEDVSRIAGAVLDQVDTVPQRRTTWWPARRTPTMNKLLTFGLGAAAVVVILLIGASQFSWFSGPALGGVPTPSVTPSDATPSTEPSSGPSAFAPGAHVIWEDAPGVGSITLTVPNGWDIHTDDHYLTATDLNNVGLLIFAADVYVYGSPCSWSTTRPDAPATTVDEVIAALVAQEDRNASAPTDFAWVGDDALRRSGRMTTLYTPDDAVFADCDQDTYGILTEPGFIDEPTRSNQEPGQIDEFWVLDVNGTPVSFDVTYFDDTPPGVVEEMRAIAESAVFGN